MESRPRSIPELRGMEMRKERLPDAKPYSAESYAAQYGISLSDAENVVESVKLGFDTHGEAKRIIQGMFAGDMELRRRALWIDEAHEMTSEERERLEAMLSRKKMSEIAESM